MAKKKSKRVPKFVFKKGKNALSISELVLLENGQEIDSDKHTGFSGGALNGVIYRLNLPTTKPGEKYTLRARIQGPGGTNSQGEIKIRAID